MMPELKRSVLGELVRDIEVYGDLMETKRRSVINLVLGKTATSRSGDRFIVDHVKLYHGGSGVRVFLEGPLLRKNGQPHAKARSTTAINLVSKIEA